MDCLGIPEISYSDWSRALHEKISAKRIPLSGSLELTFKGTIKGDGGLLKY